MGTATAVSFGHVALHTFAVLDGPGGRLTSRLSSPEMTVSSLSAELAGAPVLVAVSAASGPPSWTSTVTMAAHLLAVALEDLATQLGHFRRFDPPRSIGIDRKLGY